MTLKLNRETIEALDEEVIELKWLPPDRRTIEPALLREVNEYIASLAQEANLEVFALLCECSNPFCIQQVTISRQRFDELVETGKPVLAFGHQVETWNGADSFGRRP